MIKISEEQAVNMAYATITKDESDEKRKQIVSEILHAWKCYGYIDGYNRMECEISEDKVNKCKSCNQIFNIDITGEYPCHFCGMPTVHDTKGSAK